MKRTQTEIDFQKQLNFVAAQGFRLLEIDDYYYIFTAFSPADNLNKKHTMTGKDITSFVINQLPSLTEANILMKNLNIFLDSQPNLIIDFQQEYKFKMYVGK